MDEYGYSVDRDNRSRPSTVNCIGGDGILAAVDLFTKTAGKAEVIPGPSPRDAMGFVWKCGTEFITMGG